MVNVSFYTFTKYINSTKRPDTSGLDVPCIVKAPCSILRPRLEIAENPAIIGKNYCYIAAFSRYYFITDITFNDGIWYIDLTVDVLATYRAEIGAKEMYTLRASNRSNGAIVDTLFPMIATETSEGEILETDEISLGAGSYVVNILGDNTGSSTLYLMSPAEFSQLLSALLAEAGQVTGLDFSQAAVNAIFDPLDYIKSVIWLPVSVGEASAAFGASPVASVVAGMWDSHIAGRVLNTGAALLKTYSVTLPKHPQAARGKYLNGAPFTEYIIDYEPFGVISLDASKLVDSTTLGINIYVDAVTGMGILKAGGQTSGPVASVVAQYGVPIPMAGAASSFGAVAGTLSAAGGLIGGLLTANPALIAGSLTAGIGNFGEAAHGIVSTGGASGSMAAYQTGKTFGAVFHYVTGDDWSDCGYPLCLDITPAELGGYILPKNPHVSINGTAQEMAELHSRLEQGFFYE